MGAGGSKRKGAGGGREGSLAFSQRSRDDESGSGDGRSGAKMDKGKGREYPRNQKQQQNLPSLSKKPRPSSPSPQKSKLAAVHSTSTLSLPSPSPSSTKLSSLPAHLPSPNRRSRTPASPARDPTRIDLNAPSPSGRIREVIHYSPHLSESEAVLTDSDEEMAEPAEESAVIPVAVAVHPPSSSPVKQLELNASSSSSKSSAQLAREVTPDTLSAKIFGGLDSPLTPLPVRFADGPLSDDVVVVDGEEDDSDEIISSSEKGEGDAEPLRPVSTLFPPSSSLNECIYAIYELDLTSLSRSSLYSTLRSFPRSSTGPHPWTRMNRSRRCPVSFPLLLPSTNPSSKLLSNGPTLDFRESLPLQLETTLGTSP